MSRLLSKFYLLTLLMLWACNAQNISRISYDTVRINYADGQIFLENNKHGVFIPSDFTKKDIVLVSALRQEDSLRIQSAFSKNKLEIKSHFTGAFSNSDSTYLVLQSSGRCPIGFAVAFFLGPNKIEKSHYLGLDGISKICLKDASFFFVEVFGAKSDLIAINTLAVKDTLVLEFDYLAPEQIGGYTFIDFSIHVKQ